MTTRQVRALRGVAASFAATLVSACAHTFAGGGAPSPALIIAVALLAAPLAVVLVGRRPSFLGLTAAILASQVLFHVAFALTASVASSDGTVVDPHVAHRGGVALDAMAGHADLMPSLPMLLAHLAAAAATLIVVSRGERAVAFVARGIALLLRIPTFVATTPLPAAPRAALAPVAPPTTRIFTSVLHRRGPPVI